MGLEPTLAEANTALNRARLPIPPLRQRVGTVSLSSPLESFKNAVLPSGMPIGSLVPALALAGSLAQGTLAPARPTAAAPRDEAAISIDFKDADITDVVRLMAEVGAFQVVVDPGVSCKLTMKLKEVPWPTALDMGLRSCGLGYEEENGIVRVAPVAKLTAEHVERRRLEEERRLAGPLKTTMHRLSYARAAELAPLLKKFLSPRGEVIYDVRTNTLIITDIQ